MDDRIIAHFEPGVDYEMGMFKYTVRASYEGSGRLPDAHVEAMYSPEYHGRSNVMEFVVQCAQPLSTIPFRRAYSSGNPICDWRYPSLAFTINKASHYRPL